MTRIKAPGEKRPGFEGWYLKHQTKDHTIAFIPAFHRDLNGCLTASVQVVTEEGAWFVPFPVKGCQVQRVPFSVRIGNNSFSVQGLNIHIETEGLSVWGKLQYGPFTPLKYDIMGPFAHLPFMQCRHGVLSLTHTLGGFLCVNGNTLSFAGGTGYIEKDRGSSFPSSYLWTQCNWRSGRYHCCVMLSIADIPFLGSNFTGCICSIYHNRKEYRLATYLGAKILKYTAREAVVRQRSLLLKVKLIKDNPKPLKAPVMGDMTRSIHESPSCTVRYQFYDGQELLFDFISSCAGFESVKECPAFSLS